ncbi:class I SAM-dependent methyltransferase [Candidatus Woesearchaeota archaeon]|nr:class I SAM-dependent methyltransferase [Candidatus Woesearchaeota archaeon]
MKKLTNWVDYWDCNAPLHDKDMWKSMEIFIRGTESLLDYNENDIVLDIGCGPGYLADCLKGIVKEMHCLDTSQHNINLCKKKFKNSNNLFFHKLGRKNYTDFSFLKGKKFTKIICLSVIQYYSGIGDVRKLIENVRKIALRGSKFLIADIPTRKGVLHDAIGILKSGIMEKNLFESIKGLYEKRASEYHKLRSENGLLVLPIGKINELIKELDLSAQILNTRLTILPNRSHLLIIF